MTISYDGTCYSGWQVQPNGVTIQEVMQGAITKMTGEKATLTASGRTDAGVHAIAQVANFRTSKDISCDGFQKGLNSLLPDDIVITAVEEVSEAFHAQKGAVSKCYRYMILNGPHTTPLLKNRFWWIRNKLNVGKMRSALKCLVGMHDFSAFCASDDCNGSKVREILDTRVDVIKKDYLLSMLSKDLKIILVDVAGTGFLKNMVRNIVGTVVDVGLNKIDKKEFKEIFESHDRKRAGVNAPAHGLYLLKVQY